MQFSIVAASLALALGVAAQPQHGHGGHGGPLAIHQAKTQCDGGHVFCCSNHADIEADGVASGLLTEGLLTNVLGSGKQACAKWDLIENLNLLGFTKQGQNGQSCGQKTACCPEGKKSCNEMGGH